MNRRSFLNTLLAGALTTIPIYAKRDASQLERLSILYTIDTGIGASDNDWGNKVMRRAAYIQEFRGENTHVLVADAGGAWGNGLYHHLYRGALEMNCLAKSGYDVATLAPSEFRNGQQALQQILQKHPINWVLSNYNLSESPLGQVVRPFMIEEIGPFRIGILAVAPNPARKLLPDQAAKIAYQDPLAGLEKLVSTLRHVLNCRLIVVLSQLAHDNEAEEPGNVQIARQITGIDLIVGKSDSGQTIETLRIASKGGYLTQVAALGNNGDIGRTDFYFDRSAANG